MIWKGKLIMQWHILMMTQTYSKYLKCRQIANSYRKTLQY